MCVYVYVCVCLYVHACVCVCVWLYLKVRWNQLIDYVQIRYLKSALINISSLFLVFCLAYP